jgi:prephenate dehydratase
LRVAYLGPAGTFSEDAVRAGGFAGQGFVPFPCDTITAVIEAVASGAADRALAPIENSIEGSVRSTLDGLLEHADRITITGEHVHQIRSALIARTELSLDSIEAVISHPQPLAQCSRFLREEVAGADLRVAPSTSAAVQEVSASDRPLAALGPATAAAIYGCRVLREGIEDEPGNVTRFVWIAPTGSAPEPGVGNGQDWKTTVVFSELGADHPGALVEALLEFSDRQINLVRIESRPQRRQLGRYLFFIDIEGREEDPGVASALEGLRTKAESVRVLGSYPSAPSSGEGPAGSSS